jgi:hypothetical protein
MKKRNIVATVFFVEVFAIGIAFAPTGDFADCTNRVVGTGTVHAVASMPESLKRVPVKPAPFVPAPAEPLPLKPVPAEPLPAMPVLQLDDGLVRGNDSGINN